MAKYNDMPELNSAKVFSTILFTKEHLKLPCHQPLTTTYSGPINFDRNSNGHKDEPTGLANSIHRLSA
ncbi:hypothetical protein [Thalassomonas sp. RHCl1]|uniref:hypothetical protein n=1 Tax=Thalassomonas sp. RHCl1 TaxID=2995320 RepID=UPI00248BEF9D|nr:hypothetical protein [Thalassomonas sp. RHCl1]